MPASMLERIAKLLTRTMGPEAGLAYRILCANEGVKEGV